MGELGPHEGRELSLMLSGTKALAYFNEEQFCEDFLPYVESGVLSRHYWNINEMPIIIFSTPEGEVNVVNLKNLILEAKWGEDKNRKVRCDVEIGMLLGYQVEDIIHYLNHNSLLKS